MIHSITRNFNCWRDSHHFTSKLSGKAFCWNSMKCLGFRTVPKQPKEHSFWDGMDVPLNSAYIQITLSHSFSLSFGGLSMQVVILHSSPQSLKSCGLKITYFSDILTVWMTKWRKEEDLVSVMLLNVACSKSTEVGIHCTIALFLLLLGCLYLFRTRLCMPRQVQ